MAVYIWAWSESKGVANVPDWFKEIVIYRCYVNYINIKDLGIFKMFSPGILFKFKIYKLIAGIYFSIDFT